MSKATFHLILFQRQFISYYYHTFLMEDFKLILVKLTFLLNSIYEHFIHLKCKVSKNGQCYSLRLILAIRGN